MHNDMEFQREKLYKLLREQYKRMTISKSEMANELGIGNSTLNLYISKGIGLPNYKKLGTAKNAKVVFNLMDVADFLSRTTKTI